MSNRKKRVRKHRSHSVDMAKKPAKTVDDEKILKKAPRVLPKFKGFNNPKGRSQDSQNLRRGNR